MVFSWESLHVQHDLCRTDQIHWTNEAGITKTEIFGPKGKQAPVPDDSYVGSAESELKQFILENTGNKRSAK